MIYGRWPVREALASNLARRVLVARGSEGGPMDEIITAAKSKHIPCDFIDRRRLDQLTGTDSHQGVAAHVDPFQFTDLDLIWEEASASHSKGARLLFLDGILDPQNLGSLLRSAVFFGVSGVILPKWRAATVTPAVVRASAGAARLISIAQVANLATTLEAAKKRGFWIVGADMNGEDAKGVDLPRPFALVLGSEGEGLHALIQKKCDIITRLSRGGEGQGIGSLNVGVAGGILLHQFS